MEIDLHVSNFPCHSGCFAFSDQRVHLNTHTLPHVCVVWVGFKDVFSYFFLLSHSKIVFKTTSKVSLRSVFLVVCREACIQACCLSGPLRSSDLDTT